MIQGYYNTCSAASASVLFDKCQSVIERVVFAVFIQNIIRPTFMCNTGYFHPMRWHVQGRGAPVVPERATNRNCRLRVMVPTMGSVATSAFATPHGAKYVART